MAHLAKFDPMITDTLQADLAGLERMRDMTVPSSHHHYIVLSLLNQWLREVAAPAASGILLDYGCGGQPYRELFSRYVTQYIGADVAAAADTQLDLMLRPGEPVDLPDQSIDTILSSQVLEHLPEPHHYLRECLRLLKPQGRLIITVPMQWRQHEEPHDYFRFTRFGLEHLLNTNGLTVLDLRPCGGAFALVGQILANNLKAQGMRCKLIFRVVNRLALWLDRKYPDHADTLNWNCIASPHN
jgi:SAM-dependent methyltransferase